MFDSLFEKSIGFLNLDFSIARLKVDKYVVVSQLKGKVGCI
jgi:hypothetical protein